MDNIRAAFLDRISTACGHDVDVGISDSLARKILAVVHSLRHEFAPSLSSVDTASAIAPTRLGGFDPDRAQSDAGGSVRLTWSQRSRKAVAANVLESAPEFQAFADRLEQRLRSEDSRLVDVRCFCRHGHRAGSVEGRVKLTLTDNTIWRFHLFISYEGRPRVSAAGNDD